MMTASAMTPLRGELRENEMMSRHTTWRVGGPARNFYVPADLDDLQVYLSQLPVEEPLVWLGLGSNLLVRDGGIKGTVISVGSVLGGLTIDDKGAIRAESGVPCAKVAKFCAKHNLVGAEFLAGIPGTMGGALAMNAGAFGGETWQLVAAVETMDHAGVLHTRQAGEYEIGYRHARGPSGEWFVAAHLRLGSGDGQASLSRIRDLLEKRNVSQPMGKPTCGSVFRNPQGDHAARLIEACGLKGYCLGGACVSEKHANFIVNANQASARDIEELINYVRATVAEQQGVVLVPEVHIIGEAG